MAAAVLTAGHIQRPGSRHRARRHPDRRGHGAHGGSSSPQLPNLGMEKCSKSLCGGELRTEHQKFVQIVGEDGFTRYVRTEEKKDVEKSRNAGTGSRYIEDVYYHHESESKKT